MTGSLSDKIKIDLLEIEDVREALKYFIEWINMSEEMKELGMKYENYIHKAHLKRRIKKIFGEKLI
jgi:hypothetical protein